MIGLRLASLGAAVAVGLSLPGVRPAAAAASEVVAVVVDFAGGAGSLHSFVACVHEPAGSSDAQALSDALAQRGLTSPTFASSGLLCSIGGVPLSGCGTQTPSGYQYWAYFHGDSTWHYANDGPAERQAVGTLSEGWRFELRGQGNANDAPPPGSSDPAVLCPVATTPTTTATTVTTDSVPINVTPTTSTVSGSGPTTPSTVTTQAVSTPSTSSMVGAKSKTHEASVGTSLAAAQGTTMSTTKRSPSLLAPVTLGLVVIGMIVGGISWRRRRS